MEFAKALDSIVVEVAFEDFAVGELYPSPSLFGVVNQHALVVFPVVLEEVEVGVVEGAGEVKGVVVIDLPLAIKLIL